jgi:cytochrome P450
MLAQTDGFKVDGEVHARRRKLVTPAFTGPMVAGLESRVAAICRQQATALVDRAEVDLVREYAMPIPILVICNTLGLPMDHVAEISAGADSMVAQAGAGATREVAYQHAHNVMQLQRFVRKAIEERRRHPGTDLISQLVHARIDDPTAPTLSEKELTSISTVAVAGGVDTTRNGIAFGLHALATRPDLLARLRASKEQDKEIVHLAFGTGVHYCIGAMLARNEMKCAIREIVNRVDSLELAVTPDQLDLSNTNVILRGLKHLPVRLRAAKAA